METTEIIRILRQCGECCLTNCTECPEYKKAEEGFRKDPEAVGFMWSCGGVLLEAADRLEELRHFLETEMRITVERQQTDHPVYDGALVGRENTKLLLRNHHRFCERLLAMIEKEVSGG